MQQLTSHNLDWLRIRFPLDIPQGILDELPYNPDVDRVQKTDKGDGVYLYVDYSGVTEYPNPYRVLELGGEITRLDLCIDLEFNALEHKAYKKTIKELMKVKQTKSIWSDTGHTIYFEGGRSQGVKIRFYQKGLKEKSVIKKWYRLEFELHNPVLKKYLASSESLDEILETLFARYTNFKGVTKKVRFESPEDIPADQEKRIKTLVSEIMKKGIEDRIIEEILKKKEAKGLTYNNNML